MEEVVDFFLRFGESQNKGVMATVIETWGSSPRPVGSVMGISEDGLTAGSVSGGCVEGAVVKKALEIMDKGPQSVIMEFGVSDDMAWSAGLSCGGYLKVNLTVIDEKRQKIISEVARCIKIEQGCILVMSLEGDHPSWSTVMTDGSVSGDTLAEPLVNQALQHFEQRKCGTATINSKGYFLLVIPPRPLLIMIGAAHVSRELILLAKQMEFKCVVIDPRGIFTKSLNGPGIDAEVYSNYPSEVLKELRLDAFTFCAVLSHDPKIDDDAIRILLSSKVAYIGALGSKKTHEKRVKRLMEEGFAPELIQRIKSPIGLDIGGKTAKDLALSIISEIVQVKNKGPIN